MTAALFSMFLTFLNLVHPAAGISGSSIGHSETIQSVAGAQSGG